MSTTSTKTVEAPPDHAVRGIVASNALTLALALWQDWGLLGLLWPFWIQSVVIGVYARRRILALERFSVEGLSINDQPVTESRESAVQVANFFRMHYGFFHFVYFVFLVGATVSGIANDGILEVREEGTDEVRQLAVGKLGALDALLFGALGYAFWRSHGASHREHVAADLAGKPNLGTLMMLPYARVLPMHMTIIFGGLLGGGAAWLFVALKTVADVVMHKVEHARLQNRGGGRTTATGRGGGTS